MKLAIVNLTGGDLSGGYRKYLQTMVPLLSADRRVGRLSVFVPPGGAWPALPAETFTWTRRDARLGLRGLRRRLNEVKPDVVFIPTARWLDVGTVPVVVMVRNMEPLLVPFEGNPLATKVKNLGRAVVAYRACRRATRVVAVSEHVRGFLTDRWRIDGDRVCVVSHGVTTGPRAEGASRPRVLDRSAERFIFTAGSIRPARGLRDLVVAAARMKERAELNHHVVVGGAPDADSVAYADETKRLAERLGVGDRFHWPGRLSPAEMAWCFTECEAFVMTSWAEACPNTVLEALSYGCLSVSTDQPPMPEFFGRSAYYYRARDGEALARRLHEALTAPEAEKKLRRELAAAVAAGYDWQVTARRTVDELEAAIVGRR